MDGATWVARRAALTVPAFELGVKKEAMPNRSISSVSLNPCSGDVIVERISTGRGGFAIRRTEGSRQLLESAYTRAVKQAIAFGRYARVNVWYAEANEVLLLVANHRRD